MYQNLFNYKLNMRKERKIFTVKNFLTIFTVIFIRLNNNKELFIQKFFYKSIKYLKLNIIFIMLNIIIIMLLS